MSDDQQQLVFVDDAAPLSQSEETQLAVLEQTIERGLKTFVDVGTALMVVRDSKLYRATHTTFEDYCRVRWNMGKSRVYQMIDAATVVENLQKSKILDFLPNESQARALATLPPEVQREAYDKAVDTAPNGRVTAAHVARVVDEYEAQVEELAEDEEGYDWTEDEPVVSPPKPHVTHNSGNNEWHTPAIYVEAARAVLGAIDLDPASNAIANATVKATTYYSARDDGLSFEWRGRVFMNPPYSSSLVSDFADKLVRHYAEGDVPSAIVLVNNATETQWFQQLAAACSAICFPKSRIRFVGENEKAQTGLQGQAFIYIGRDVDAFALEFGRFGLIVRPL